MKLAGQKWAYVPIILFALGSAILAVRAIVPLAAKLSVNEYQKGYCDGAKAAAEVVWANRNHNRALEGFAPETQEQAMKRIYSSWPAPPAPRLKEGPHLDDGIIASVDNILLDSIDLYVVLPLKPLNSCWTRWTPQP
jgi:hypothetical protein